MSGNVLQTTQRLLQDVIAPDVRESKVRMAVLEDHIEELRRHMEVSFHMADKKNDAQFKALLAAISESRAQGEVSTMRVVASLSERVAVLESHRQRFVLCGRSYYPAELISTLAKCSE